MTCSDWLTLNISGPSSNSEEPKSQPSVDDGMLDVHASTQFTNTQYRHIVAWRRREGAAP